MHRGCVFYFTDCPKMEVQHTGQAIVICEAKNK